MRGEDVRQLQLALNTRARNRDMQTIKVDGVYGVATARLMREVAYQLGALQSTISRGATVGIQRMIREPHKRTAAQKQRAKARRRRHAKPKIVSLRAPVSQQFGGLGTFIGLVGHYTAGPRDTSDAHGLALLRAYNSQHRAQGWGGIGYHLAILSSGTIVRLRPVGWKGTHVAGANTGRVGVVVLGGPGQRMTSAQRASWAWLIANGHTTAMPSSHRLPAKPQRVWVHSDLNATACPGAYKTDYRRLHA